MGSHPFSWSTGGVQGVTLVGCFLLAVYPGGGVGGPGGLGQGGALASVSKPLLQRMRGNGIVDIVYRCEYHLSGPIALFSPL